MKPPKSSRKRPKVKPVPDWLGCGRKITTGSWRGFLAARGAYYEKQVMKNKTKSKVRPGVWIKAGSIHANPEYHSNSLGIIPLLLALPYRKTADIGWFYAGHLNEFRVEGSPSKAEPTHWMPLPAPPKP